VPQYSFIVPNDWDQGEKLAPGSSCTQCQADTFLSTEIPKIQASSAYQNNGVILVLWDESAGTDTNPSGLIVVSNLAKKGYEGGIAYSHGSTLRTVQEMFGLTPLLGDAANATDLADLFTTPPFVSTPPQPSAPQAAFTASPTSGTAPLPVTFTDTSTGTPTSWSWDFGDGSSSTLQNPSHTYATGGSYTVTLTATNSSGATSTQQAIAVSPPAGTSGSVSIGASITAVSTSAVRAVKVPRLSGLAAGDLVVAQISSDGGPTMSAVPSGWTAVTSRLAASGETLFAYSHRVSDPTKEPSTWTFTLSSRKTWNAGATAFRNVSTTTPFDTAASRVVSGSTTALAVPGVTTVTPGALLIGGAGANSASVQIAPPTGWTEAWEADGGQDTAFTTRAMPTAGASGTASFGFSSATAGAGWIRALRPAG
jgi:PKD repeat protein